ncbi:MAG: M48 family metallopeptidase [Bacteroidaceae bacterium]|nr:M48 family metallopeptidase [Bacteroidaceae bacterium]
MVLTKSILEHPKWGVIFVTRNPRARRIILRSRPGGIYITVPAFATKHDIEKAIDECAPKLLQRRPTEEAVIDLTFRIESNNFIFYIEEHDSDIFQLRYKGKETVLLCPKGTDYQNRQEWMRKAVTTAVLRRAKELLPPRLKQLAQKKGFTYNRCIVKNVHTRWGSCSTKGNINLNMHLVQLPNELIDYVLLHELCHTVEMNHSERFWTLLDSVTAPAKAKELRKKLKEYKMQF